MKDSNFSRDEVEEFRELFMGDDNRKTICFKEVVGMLRGVLPMNNARETEFLEIFEEVVGEATVRGDEDGYHRQASESSDYSAGSLGTGLTAEFPEFLLIVRRLLDSNFANIDE